QQQQQQQQQYTCANLLSPLMAANHTRYGKSVRFLQGCDSTSSPVLQIVTTTMNNISSLSGKKEKKKKKKKGDVALGKYVHFSTRENKTLKRLHDTSDDNDDYVGHHATTKVEPEQLLSISPQPMSLSLPHSDDDDAQKTWSDQDFKKQRRRRRRRRLKRRCTHETKPLPQSKQRNPNQFEALLKHTHKNHNEFHAIEMDMTQTNHNAKKIRFDPSAHSAIYDPSTNMIVWSNGKKWVRKDFVPFRGRWRDPQGHVISIEENGLFTYVEPRELGTYTSVVCGFYKIGITCANYTYTAKLIDKNVLKWDNGIQWYRVDKPESCLVM
ncbi:hypothetical protein RFI_06088, partial [Reticulomyxa filosa]